jgi:hypothetical protein
MKMHFAYTPRGAMLHREFVLDWGRRTLKTELDCMAWFTLRPQNPRKRAQTDRALGGPELVKIRSVEENPAIKNRTSDTQLIVCLLLGYPATLVINLSQLNNATPKADVIYVVLSNYLITLMMEAASTSETSVNFYKTTRRNNPEDSHLLSNYLFSILPSRHARSLSLRPIYALELCRTGIRFEPQPYYQLSDYPDN